MENIVQTKTGLAKALYAFLRTMFLFFFPLSLALASVVVRVQIYLFVLFYCLISFLLLLLLMLFFFDVSYIFVVFLFLCLFLCLVFVSVENICESAYVCKHSWLLYAMVYSRNNNKCGNDSFASIHKMFIYLFTQFSVPILDSHLDQEKKVQCWKCVRVCVCVMI